MSDEWTGSLIFSDLIGARITIHRVSELIPYSELHVPRQCPPRSTGDDAKGRIAIAEVWQAKALCIRAVQAIAVNLQLAASVAKLIHAFHANVGVVDTVATYLREIAGSIAGLLVAGVCEAIGVEVG
jgi:hypothetical protein